MQQAPEYNMWMHNFRTRQVLQCKQQLRRLGQWGQCFLWRMTPLTYCLSSISTAPSSRYAFATSGWGIRPSYARWLMRISSRHLWPYSSTHEDYKDKAFSQEMQLLGSLPDTCGHTGHAWTCSALDGAKACGPVQIHVHCTLAPWQSKRMKEWQSHRPLASTM